MQELSVELVQVNEHVCQLPPFPTEVRDELASAALGTTLRAVQDAVNAEVGQLLNVISVLRRSSAASGLEVLVQEPCGLAAGGAHLLQELLDQPEHTSARQRRDMP